MLKKTVTYTDFNGNEQTEDFYFNLKKSELLELQASVPGGFDQKMQAINEAQDEKEILSTIKMFILSAYGVPSKDGKRFVKSQELRDEFEQTEAYSEIFMSLFTNENAAAEFIRAIVPADIAADVAKLGDITNFDDLKKIQQAQQPQ